MNISTFSDHCLTLRNSFGDIPTKLAVSEILISACPELNPLFLQTDAKLEVHQDFFNMSGCINALSSSRVIQLYEIENVCLIWWLVCVYGDICFFLFLRIKDWEYTAFSNNRKTHADIEYMNQSVLVMFKHVSGIKSWCKFCWIRVTAFKDNKN